MRRLEYQLPVFSDLTRTASYWVLASSSTTASRAPRLPAAVRGSVTGPAGANDDQVE
jgi:hypothetical protein